MTATAAGLSGSPVTFTATGVAGSATQVRGHVERLPASRGSSVTVSAQLADQYGNAVRTSGISVTWSKTGAGGSFGSSTSPTNADGVGVGDVRDEHGSRGRLPDHRYRRELPVGYEPRHHQPSSMHRRIGHGERRQRAVGDRRDRRGRRLPACSSRDVYNNICDGIPVTFAVASGGGSVTAGAAVTNASGIAAAGSWILGPAAGTNTLTATVSGLAPVTFTATGVVGIRLEVPGHLERLQSGGRDLRDDQRPARRPVRQRGADVGHHRHLEQDRRRRLAPAAPPSRTPAASPRRRSPRAPSRASRTRSRRPMPAPGPARATPSRRSPVPPGAASATTATARRPQPGPPWPLLPACASRMPTAIRAPASPSRSR